MDFDESKEAKNGCIATNGSLTGDERWLISKDYVTGKTTRLSSKVIQSNMSIMNIMKGVPSKTIQFFDSDTNVMICQDCSTEHGYITYDKDGNFLRLVKRHVKTGLNGFYVYSSKPAFEGQVPSKEKISEEDNTPIYVCGRFFSFPEQDNTTSYVVYSAAKGLDQDAKESGLGLLWKDIYKVIKVPQFQYAAIGFDMDGNMIMKSKQESAVRTRPVFEIAPGVDLLSITLSCFPLFPAGEQILDTADNALDIALLFVGF